MTHATFSPTDSWGTPAGGASANLAPAPGLKPGAIDGTAPTGEPTRATVLHAFKRPKEIRSCIEEEAPSGTEATGSTHGIVQWVRGVEPVPRPLLPGYDDAVTALVAGIFILLVVSVSRHTTFLKTFASALLSGRRRQNTFDDEHTIDETRITAALLIVCCVCEGIMLYFASTLTGAAMPPFTAIAAGTGVAVALMGFQTLGYLLTGYAFASRPGDTRQWLRGFFASQSLLGLCLTLPALTLLFYPGAAAMAVGAAVALYVIARLMFIAKGFRFFYTNIGSLVYFISYLCTLEIVPIVFLVRMSLNASTML